MALYFHNQGVTFNLRIKNKIRAWVRSAIQQENKILGEINLIFCTDDYLKQINEQYLQHDYYTDIITFQYSASPLSGDLFMSLDRIKDNAKHFGVPLKNEVLRVIIHGVLHLCGYTDQKPKEKQQMRQKEDFFLSQMAEYLNN